MRLCGAKWVLLPAALAALVACGGGGNTPATESTVGIGGVVAKGPAKGAKVYIYKADGKTLADGPIVTGVGGTYTAKVKASDGPFLVEVDLEGAEITDDLDSSKTYTGQAGQKLRAVVQDASNSVNVTPFSDLAAELALAAGEGTLTAAAVDGANKKVRQILGDTIDFLSASPTEGAMLAKLQAVQQLVNDSSLTEVLQQIRDAAKVSDDGFAVEGLMDALKGACEKAELSACDSAFAPEEQASTPVKPEVIVAIAAVKALFQDLRDTLLAYSNSSGTGELDQAGVKIADALAVAASPVDDEQIKVVAMSLDADKLLRSFQAGTSTQRLVNSSDYAYGQVATKTELGANVSPTWLPKVRCEVGKATFITTASGNRDVKDYTAAAEQVTPENANVVSCFGIGTVGRLYPGKGDGFAYYHSMLLLPKAGGNYDYVHQLRRQPFDRTQGSATRLRAVYGSLNMTRNAGGELTGAAVSGKLIPGFKSNGAPGAYETLDRVDTTLNIATNRTATTDQLNVTGALALFKNDGTLASRVDIASGTFAGRTDIPQSYYDVIEVGTGGCPAGYSPAFGTTSPNLWCDGMVAGTTSALGTVTLDVSIAAPGVKFQGIATAGSAMFDKSKTAYYPTVTTLQGKLSEADGGSYRVLLDGLAKVELQNYASFDATTGAPAALKAEFDGKILLKNRPEMRFAMAGTRDASNVQTATGTFRWNGKALSFEGKADKSLVVRNDDGVSFTIPHNGGKSYQPIYKSGVELGRINLDLQRIEFADGTFSQF